MYDCMVQGTHVVGDQTATLILNRHPGKRDGWRAYRVMVDGNKVAVLNEGETRELTLSPGDHEVWIKLDWTRSPKIKLNLAEASRTHLQCRAGGGAWMEPIDASFRPTRYIELTEPGA
jgi:hypothetical protein